ncbi:MAG: chemotaxis protein CheW [Thermotaleaceae bacterium]
MNEQTNVNKKTAEQQYVLFELDNELYGIDILQVETIEKVMDITRVPHASSYVEGVINLRGEVVPVINLRKRFNLSETILDDESRIMIVSVEDVIIGLLVDSSSEVVQLDLMNIDEAPELGEQKDMAYIKGIGKKDDNIIILLDIKKVLGITESDI